MMYQLSRCNVTSTSAISLPIAFRYSQLLSRLCFSLIRPYSRAVAVSVHNHVVVGENLRTIFIASTTRTAFYTTSIETSITSRVCTRALINIEQSSCGSIVRNNTGISDNNYSPPLPIKKKKKKLKKNQLGQKGQNRVQMKKEREKKQQLRLQEQEKQQRKNMKKMALKKKRQIRTQHVTLTGSTDNDVEYDDDEIEFDDNNNGDDNIISHDSLSEEQSVTEDNDSSDTNDSTIPTILRPPSMLISTASRNVFVSKIACEVYDIDPKTWFTPNSLNLNNSSNRRFYVHFPNATFELPSFNQPEIAILGRSNVGKSSLINAIIRRKGLAITSKQPGRTQQAYYYGLIPSGNEDADTNSVSSSKDLQNSVSGFIVDLPGYGFAVGSDERIDDWQKRTQEFLLNRRDNDTLKHLYLLQDARVGATNLDINVQNWMDDASIPYSVVLTKIDAVGPSTIIKHVNLSCLRFFQKYTELRDNDDDDEDNHRHVKDFQTTANTNDDEVFMSPFVYTTSAKSNIGIDELRKAIEMQFKHL